MKSKKIILLNIANILLCSSFVYLIVASCDPPVVASPKTMPTILVSYSSNAVPRGGSCTFYITGESFDSNISNIYQETKLPKGISGYFNMSDSKISFADASICYLNATKKISLEYILNVGPDYNSDIIPTLNFKIKDDDSNYGSYSSSTIGVFSEVPRIDYIKPTLIGKGGFMRYEMKVSSAVNIKSLSLEGTLPKDLLLFLDTSKLYDSNPGSYTYHSSRFLPKIKTGKVGLIVLVPADYKETKMPEFTFKITDEVSSELYTCPSATFNADQPEITYTYPAELIKNKDNLYKIKVKSSRNLSYLSLQSKVPQDVSITLDTSYTYTSVPMDNNAVFKSNIKEAELRLYVRPKTNFTGTEIKNIIFLLGDEKFSTQKAIESVKITNKESS